MVNKKNFIQVLSLTTVCLGLTACGGGGGNNSDPAAYTPTTPGQGSTVASAETNGTIQYTQYQATNTVMSDGSFSTPLVSASVNFSTTSKQGSIQFPVSNSNEVISTSDGYTTTSWTGPFTSGSYRLNGNALMGCNASASTDVEVTQVFVSSSLARVKDGAIDELRGLSFDVVDCSLMKLGKAETLKVNTDGSLYLSTFNSTIPTGQVFDMLNPEKYPGFLINNGDRKTTGVYSGRAFRYGSNGANKYAIVIQTSAGYVGSGIKFHYLLAVQR
jgi:hypothetical protein